MICSVNHLKTPNLQQNIVFDKKEILQNEKVCSMCKILLLFKGEWKGV